MEQTRAESILALDVGAAYTKAALFDVVEGQPRFIAKGAAPSTIYPPGGDVVRGAIAAVQQVAEIVGRPLLGPHGPLALQRPIVPEKSDGRGVDACVVVSSVGSLLRALVIGSTGPGTANLVSEVGGMPEVAVVGATNLDTKLLPGVSHMQQILTALRQQRPHVVVVADGSAAKTHLGELAQAFSIGIPAGSPGPAIIFLGEEEGGATLQRALRDRVNIYRLPAIASAAEGFTPLQQRLQALWQEAWQAELPGSADLDWWSDMPPYPGSHGFANALRFLAAHHQTDVWGLDVGAGSTAAISVVGGLLTVRVHPGLGVGQGSAALLGGSPALGQWLPSSVHTENGELADAVLRKCLHYCAVPESEADLAFEGALAREAAGKVLEPFPVRQTDPSRHSAMLVGRGAVFAETPSFGHAILLLLDAFQPVGLVDLAVDRLGVLPMLGAIARRLPDVAAPLLLREGLQRFGPCLALGGAGKADDVAAQLTFVRGGQKVRAKVLCGAITVLPLIEGETAQLTVKPAGRLDCGFGPGRNATYTVQGGPLGVLVVDARGRPLAPANLGPARLDRLAAWRAALNA